jgi:hypothetical protein
MLFGAIERPRALEVLAAGGELAHGHVGRAKRAVRQAQSGGVAVTLGLSQEIRRRVPLQGDLATDVMARPNSVQD